MIHSAATSFSKRCFPELILPPAVVIDDSLEDTVRYIVTIWSVLRSVIHVSRQALFPFQLDLCIVFKKPVSVDNDDEEADDGVEDSEAYFVDCVADIQAKLEANELQYSWALDTSERPLQRHIRSLFQEFKNDFIYKEEFMHRKRFIMMLDRRNRVDDAKIWFYEPPKDCRDIPSDAVPEWFLSASRTCLLPPADPKGYCNSKDTGLSSTGNIGSTTSCGSALMTLSFHMLSSDAIKCYSEVSLQLPFSVHLEP